MASRLLISICITAFACTRGPRVSSFAPALAPSGAAASIDTRTENFDGELLAVSDTALALLRGGMVALVPYGAIDDVVLPQFDAKYDVGYARPDTLTLTRLRLRSRFPQGLTPEAPGAAARRLPSGRCHGAPLVSRPPVATFGALLAAALAASVQAARALQRDSAVVEFLSAAGRGTARFRDPASALAAGYRPIGPETPAMGQHWLHPALLVEGRLDPAVPQVLMYATVASRRMLVGVAYAIPLGPGQAPPDGPVTHHLWHAHEGRVDEESLSDSHAGSGAQEGDRVAVLHAWIWVENPAGPFASENWALPYLRMGIAPPHAASEIAELAAQALALGSGGGAFYETAARSRVQHDSAGEQAVAHAVAAFSDSVSDWRRRRVGGDSLSSAEAEWLAGLWKRVARVLRTQDGGMP